MTTTTGRTPARQGISDALAAAISALSIAHHDVLAAALDSCIAAGNPFTAEDVRTTCPPETVAWMDDHPNVVGGMFSQAKNAGRITVDGWTIPARITRRGNTITIWKGITDVR